MATQSEKTPTNTFLKLNKNVRSMPDWVTEAHDRIGPKPPAPPPSPGASNGPSAKPPLLPPKTANKSPEPDYEVIEFSGQQYSNEPPPNGAEKRSKTPDTKPKCTLCGSNNPWVRCDECAQQIFCASCDDMFHRHPKRKNHLRKALEVSRPPLPAKMLPGQPRPAPPVAPPRRSKRGNAATPLMQRKDQVSMVRASVPASPTPSDGSRNAAWPERGADAFAIRGMNLSNRPLPDTPKTPTTPSDDMLSSRSTTPRSVFDAIQRPPSVTLEKIKSKASATLDRMAQLQQRYRQQKEERERNRSGSVTDQNFPFDQWSNISPSPSHFRSGSMSSGLNLSHFDLSEDSHFHLFHQRQAQSQQPQQQHFAADRTAHLAQRPTSSSVFNLNQLNRRPAPVEINSNQWPSNQQMLQAHSMAHLNWPHSNQRPQPNDWSNQFCPNQQLNRSNLSLNVGTGYLMAPQHPVSMYPTSPPSAAAAPPPPPVFMNTRGMMPNMYPYPYPGMPFMSPGIVAMPPPARSRGASRASSRLPSPTLSRRSLSLRNKKRSSYTETTPTDDEDSDQDDRRSLMSNRSGLSGVARQRRVPQGFLDDSESSHSYSLRSKMREQRHGSFVKPVANQNEWLPDRRASMSNARPSETGSVVSPLKSSRIYSDLDSEGSGTRALVQAKIQQKLDEEPSKRRSTRGRESSRAKQGTESTVVKKCAEVQAGRVRSTKESAQEEEQQQNNNNNNNKENLYPNNASSRPFDSREVSKERTKPKHHTDSAPNESEETCSEEADKKGKDESPPLGPPPGTPDHEWECEFCTFVNEPKVKICTICCKTPSKAPESLPPKTQPVAAAKAKPRDARGPTTRQAPETPSSNHADPRDHRVRTARNRQPTNSKDLHAQAQVPPTQPADLAAAKADPKKDSESFDDIWTTLEEDIQATAGAVIRKAESRIQQEVSTISCGTSPQRQLPPESEAGGREKITLQNDTNPAPQSISTQTYETLPLHHRKQEERYEDPNVVVLDNPRDLQESTATPAEPAPSAIMTGNNLQYLRDLALLQTERDRYRSSGDLRRIDISPMDYSPVPSLGRRQSSVAELLLLHRGPQQLGSYSPLPGLLNDPSSAYHEMKTLRDPETELYLLIKEAELYKFTSEELHIALKFCAYDTHPVQWLRENWFKLVQTVQNLATKYGQERAENTIGTVSENEAREALRLHFGNIWQAVSECIEQRQRKFRELSNRGNFSREDIVTALTTHHGNAEASMADLNKTQLSPFLMRIWGSPGGAENESGAKLQSKTESAPNGMDAADTAKADIHQFLTENASQSFYDVTGPYTPNKKLHTQFASSNDFHHDQHHPHQRLRNTSEDFAKNTLQSNAVDSLEGFEAVDAPPQNYNNNNNNNMLKDLEILIGNMENNQNHRNEVAMNERIVFNNDPVTDSDGETKRICMKSPINLNAKSKADKSEEPTADAADVKNFVWQHIQEIVPDLVQQVEEELMQHEENDKNSVSGNVKEPALNLEKLIVDKVNVRQLSLRFSLLEYEPTTEFIYAAEISTFQMYPDQALLLEEANNCVPLSFDEIPVQIFKMFTAPYNTAAQAQKDPLNVPEEGKHQKNLTLPEIQGSSQVSLPKTNTEEETYKCPLTSILNPKPCIELKSEEVGDKQVPFASGEIEKDLKEANAGGEDGVDRINSTQYLKVGREVKTNTVAIERAIGESNSSNSKRINNTSFGKEKFALDHSEKFEKLLEMIPNPAKKSTDLVEKFSGSSKILLDLLEMVADSSERLSIPPSEGFSHSLQKLPDSLQKFLNSSQITGTPTQLSQLPLKILIEPLPIATDHLEKLADSLENLPDLSNQSSVTSEQLQQSNDNLKQDSQLIEILHLKHDSRNTKRSDENIATKVMSSIQIKNHPIINGSAAPKDDDSQNAIYALTKETSKVNLEANEGKNRAESYQIMSNRNEDIPKENNIYLSEDKKGNILSNQLNGEIVAEEGLNEEVEEFGNKTNEKLLDNSNSLSHQHHHHHPSTLIEFSATNNVSETIKPQTSLEDTSCLFKGKLAKLPLTTSKESKAQNYLRKSKIPVRKMASSASTKTAVDQSKLIANNPNASGAFKEFHLLSSVANENLENRTNEEASTSSGDMLHLGIEGTTVGPTIDNAQTENDPNEHENRLISQEKLPKKTLSKRTDGMNSKDIYQNTQNTELKMATVTNLSNEMKVFVEMKKEAEEDTFDGSEDFRKDSSNSLIDEAIDRDELRSPNSETEMLLVLDNPGEQSSSLKENDISPSPLSYTSKKAINTPNTATTTPTTLTTTTPTTQDNFIAKSYPSKQNLTELVEDTQRLIKQMRDEISMDDLEFSEEDYSDEYSENYDNEALEAEGEEEEEWDDGEGEGEEEEEEDEDWIDEEDDIEEVYFEEEKEDANEEEIGLEEDDANEEEIGLKEDDANEAEIGLKEDDANQEEIGLEKDDANQEEIGLEEDYAIQEKIGLEEDYAIQEEIRLGKDDAIEEEEVKKRLNEDQRAVIAKGYDIPPTQSEINSIENNVQYALENEIIIHSKSISMIPTNILKTETSSSSSSSSTFMAPKKGFTNTQKPFLPVENNQLINKQLITEDLPAVVTEESMPKDNKLDSANPPSTNATSNRLSRTEVEQSDNGLGGEEQVLPPKKTVPVPANITKELPQTQKQFLVKDAEEQRLPSVHPQSTTATNNVPIKTEEFTEERNLKSPIAEIETEPWQNSSQPTQDLTIIQKGPPDHQATTLSSYKSSDKIEIQDNSEALSQASTSTNGLIEKNTEQKTDFCGGDEQIPKIHASREDLTLTTTTQTNPVTKTLRDLANDDTDEISGSSSNPAQPFESTARNNGELPKRAASDGPLIDGAPTLARTQIKTSSKTNPSKIPKPKSTGFRVQKMPARSKSFSSPSPPQTGISSIKAIQKVFLNNQTPSKKSAEAKTLPTSIVKRKNAITAVISKLNQPAESSNNGNSSTSPSKLTGLSAPGFSRSRTQPRIPKKNYHETCFSDEDYRSSETTDLEEEEEEAYQGDETPEVRQRKQSVPVFRAYAAVQEPEVVNPEELSRQFLRDQLVSNEAEAQVAATLVGLRFQQDVSLWAAKECTDLEHAIALLQQECELCMGTRALNEMVSMLKCTHKCCKQCAKSYFTVQITDRSINDCNCPFCKMPELHGQNGQQEDENLEYFSNLDILLKNILDPAVHELFQRKLRDRTLLQDPNFKWCIQCSSGFFARPKQRRLICPDCGSVTCSQCRKTWEKQHEGLSCEQFLAWKEANDPEVQAQGVQQHLAQNGIDCPKCKFRYSLTRGGCMHFTCTQCKFEFCYGCSRAFMMGAKCKKSPYCSKLGLHAHHPRNCLFYLRDKLPVQLQFLLKENGVNYEVEALLKASNGGNETTNHKAGLCPIQIQKETPKGLVDTVCNGDITDKQAGLCRAHYVEYLTAIVAKAGIDPLPIFDLTDCVQELRRRGIPLPERGPWDTDEIYKNMCSEIIKEKIPLNSD